MLRRNAVALSISVLTLLTACGGDDKVIGSPDPTSDGSTPLAVIPAVTADAPFPAARCEANKAAGVITYLSSFDFAATASIVDVVMASAASYYDALCLNVVYKPSFSVDNYPLVAANEVQFSSGGSFSEMVDFAGANDAGFVALAVEGRTGIDTLITKDGAVPTLADIKGKKIGVKGALTPSVKAMLAKAGLIEGTDYETVLLDGFDPTVHIEVPDIVGFPGYKSNEPNQLTAAGIKFKAYDPADSGIPGSFGILYTNQQFLTEHPTAAQDFMRATMRGLADALADPTLAATTCVEVMNSLGNTLHLSADGEMARWKVESKLVAGSATTDAPLGLPLIDQLTAEVTAYAAIGLFNGLVPEIDTLVDASVLAGIYDKGTLIWPKA